MSTALARPTDEGAPGPGRILSATLRTLAMLTVALVLSMTGCAATDSTPTPQTATDAPDALVIIAGVHAGMPAADLPSEVQATVTAAVEAKAPVSVIANDGTPEVVFRAADYDINVENPQAHDNTVNRVISAMLQSVRSTKPDSDGNNLGGSLSVAGDQLSASGAKAGTVIVVDNGLSDLGYPALTTPGLLDADHGEEIVRFAEARGQMLSLPEGTTVYLVGLGYTAAPQQDLTPIQRDIVAKTWATYLQAAGAQVATITVPRSGSGPETTRTTTLVEPGIYEQLSIERSETQTTVTLKSISFDPDSPRLTEAAGIALQQIIGMINETSGPITITGHTDIGATGFAGGHTALALARAESVRTWLVANGADASRISTFGKGADEPLYPNPSNDDERTANRRVILTFTTPS